jgi:hypothetical protein
VGYASWSVTGGALIGTWLAGGPAGSVVTAMVLTLLSIIALVWSVSFDLPSRLTPDKLRQLQHQRDSHRPAD